MQAPGSLGCAAGAAGGAGAGAACGAPADGPAAVSGLPPAAGGASKADCIISLLGCPVRTPLCAASDEAAGEVKAYKLGKRKRSYNAVSVVLECAGDAARVCHVSHAAPRPGGGLPLPAGPAPVLQYDLHVPGGTPALRAALYLVYAVPLPAEQAALLPAASGDGGDGAAPQHAWLSVSRALCCRGCEHDVPLMAGIQRLGRTGAGRPPAAQATPAAGERAPRRAIADGAAEEAAEAAGSREGSRVKDARHIYVSIDEPSAHVAPGPGGTRRFRLLLAVWAPGGGGADAPPGRLLGVTLSRPINVVSNNDVPGGAAALTLRVPLLADWDGWAALPVPRLLAPAAEAAAPPMPAGAVARRAPLHALPFNAPEEAQAARRAAVCSGPASGADSGAAAGPMPPPAAPPSAGGAQQDGLHASSAAAAATAALAAAPTAASPFLLIGGLCAPPGAAAPAAPSALPCMLPPDAAMQPTPHVQPPRPDFGVDALLSLGGVAAHASPSDDADALLAEAAPLAPGGAAASGDAGAAATAAHGVQLGTACIAGGRRTRAATAPGADEVGAAGVQPRLVDATPTAAEGAEALAALQACTRANGLPPMRLNFRDDGGDGDADAAADDDEPVAAAGAAAKAARGGKSTYSRKDHSLRTLCQRFLQLYAHTTDAVSISSAETQMGIKARRIYDVVNVMETLGIMTRRSKGAYAFSGVAGFEATLARIADAPPVREASPAAAAAAAPAAVPGGIAAGSAGAFAEIQAAVRAAAAAQPGADSTLAGLTQRFVRLLLGAGGDAVLWEDCLARLGESERASRRLYDVANVLCAIRLIDKVPGGKYVFKGAASVAAMFQEAVQAGAADAAGAAPLPVPAAQLPAAPPPPPAPPVVLKRPRAPRQRSAAGAAAKRPRAAAQVAAEGAAVATPAAAAPMEGVSPHAAGADDAPAAAAPAALVAELLACADALKTTPASVLGDALMSPDAGAATASA